MGEVADLNQQSCFKLLARGSSLLALVATNALAVLPAHAETTGSAPTSAQSVTTVADPKPAPAPVFRDPYADASPAVRGTDMAQYIPLPPPPNPTVVPPVRIGDQFPRPDDERDEDENASPALPSPPMAPVVDGAAPSPDQVESLRDAIVASLKQNPDIQIALARQDDARFGVNQAWAGYLPHVDMTVAVGREYNDPYKGNRTTLQRTEGSLTVNQNLFDFGATINDIKRARAAYRSAQWGTREKIESITYDMTTAYLDLLERQKLLDLTIEEIAANQKILKMVTIQNDLGLTTPADVDRAKARLENVQSALLDRQSAMQQAREAYRRITNHVPGRATDLPSPAASLPATVSDAVAMIDAHSPRMAQAVEDRRSLERQKASQTGTFFPRIGLQAQGNWKDNVQGPTKFNNDARAMVTVSYSFFNGGADIAIRNRIAARLREADYELERRRREVEQDIRIDFNALEAARDKTTTIESEIVSAKRVVELYRQQFREGKRSVFDLLDSQQLLFTARTNQIVNRTAQFKSEFRVLQKLGGLFDLVSNGEPLPPLVTPAPSSKK